MSPHFGPTLALRKSGCLPAVGRNTLRCRHAFLLTWHGTAWHGIATQGIGTPARATWPAFLFSISLASFMPPGPKQTRQRRSSREKIPVAPPKMAKSPFCVHSGLPDFFTSATPSRAAVDFIGAFPFLARRVNLDKEIFSAFPTVISFYQFRLINFIGAAPTAFGRPRRGSSASLKNRLFKLLLETCLQASFIGISSYSKDNLPLHRLKSKMSNPNLEWRNGVRLNSS